MALYLETIMSPDAVKLLTDCRIILVGDRLLRARKAQINYEHGLRSEEFDSARYDRYRDRYIAILKTFRDQKLELDQS
jgi:hypothetical protein